MESVSECTICYEKCHEDNFFSLECCLDKRICRACLGCLTVPLCPYCRKIIPVIKDDPKYRISRSYTENSSLFVSHLYDDEEELIDPRTLDSRILRRRMRRLRKLQLREEDKERNRQFYRR